MNANTATNILGDILPNDICVRGNFSGQLSSQSATNSLVNVTDKWLTTRFGYSPEGQRKPAHPEIAFT